MSSDVDRENDLASVPEVFTAVREILCELESNEPEGRKITYQHLGVIIPLTDWVFEKKSEVKDNLNWLKESLECTQKLMDSLKCINNQVGSWIDEHVDAHLGSWSPELPYENQVHIRLQSSVLEVLAATQKSIEVAKVRLHYVKSHYELKDRGTEVNLPARHVAYEIAKLYFWLTRSLPKFSKTNREGPSTRYTRIVANVFKELGFKADYKSPCEYAVRRLKRELPHKHLTP